MISTYLSPSLYTWWHHPVPLENLYKVLFKKIFPEPVKSGAFGGKTFPCRSLDSAGQRNPSLMWVLGYTPWKKKLLNQKEAMHLACSTTKLSTLYLNKSIFFYYYCIKFWHEVFVVNNPSWLFWLTHFQKVS